MEKMMKNAICRLLCVLCALGITETRDDHAEYLVDFQHRACPNERTRIECPPLTTINVQWVQYQRMPLNFSSCSALASEGYKDEETNDIDQHCVAASSFEMISDQCNNKKSCLFQYGTSKAVQDPCPEIHKYIQVFYQCYPSTDLLRSRLACNGEEVFLQCSKSKVVVINSAKFRSYPHTGAGEPECATNSFSRLEDCPSQCGAAGAISKCQGQRKCRFTVNEALFGISCLSGTVKYLELRHSCVPKRILHVEELSKAASAEDCGLKEESKDDQLKLTTISALNNYDHEFIIESNDSNDNTTQTGSTPGRERQVEDEESAEHGLPAFLPDIEVQKPATQRQDLNTSIETQTRNVSETDRDILAISIPNNFVTDWISLATFMSNNKERIILYTLLAAMLALIFILLAIVIRLLLAKRQQPKSSTKSENQVDHKRGDLKKAMAKNTSKGSKVLTPLLIDVGSSEFSELSSNTRSNDRTAPSSRYRNPCPIIHHQHATSLAAMMNRNPSYCRCDFNGTLCTEEHQSQIRGLISSPSSSSSSPTSISPGSCSATPYSRSSGGVGGTWFRPGRTTSPSGPSSASPCSGPTTTTSSDAYFTLGSNISWDRPICTSTLLSHPTPYQSYLASIAPPFPTRWSFEDCDNSLNSCTVKEPSKAFDNQFRR